MLSALVEVSRTLRMVEGREYSTYHIFSERCLHLLHVRFFTLLLRLLCMPPRKRKRDQAFIDEVEPEINEINVSLNEEQRAEKEQEIWDAIRETHYEGKYIRRSLVT